MMLAFSKPYGTGPRMYRHARLSDVRFPLVKQDGGAVEGSCGPFGVSCGAGQPSRTGELVGVTLTVPLIHETVVLVESPMPT